MRRFAAVAATLGALIAAATAFGTAGSRTQAEQSTLRKALASGLAQLGSSDGALVVDLTTGQQLFSWEARTPRMPASVEKLYTTSTALLRLGPRATLTTTIFGSGSLDGRGRWRGTLYIKGGGDPTFGSASFDSYAYGTGATIQRLVHNLRTVIPLKAFSGKIVGDESYFDSLRGTPPYGYQFSPDVEGSLSALAYNRGLINQGSAYVLHPALYAASQLESALRAAGVGVAAKTAIRAGAVPAGVPKLATVHSPRMATLIQLTNTPSDNFFAEMLLKGIGARFGGAGTTAAGAAAVRAQIAASFGIHPTLEDGSGLSRNDSTSPSQVVTLLADMAHNSDFVGSLAIAGETGTLSDEMQGTAAQGRCRGKTGTLHDAANLVGYCRARDGHNLAFAFLTNYVDDPSYAHAVEAKMAVAVARYNG
jgi:D-alanyl-D-alanine carboxypeptidase/D-alanyl-D-alanine-endopeptidase (penicillin-binding protein 4)